MNDENRTDEPAISRRKMIEALGLGVLAIPALASGEEIRASASGTAERIILPAERDLIEMQPFVDACIAANKESDPQAAVTEVLTSAVSDPGAMLNAIGEPSEAGLKVFHSSETLTIFAATWTPQMNLMPHNHLMWANIGIYSGREDNIFWRHTEDSIEAAGAKTLGTGEVATLGRDIIHSVINPIGKMTTAIHVYGGDFFEPDEPRKAWDPETLVEGLYDFDEVRA